MTTYKYATVWNGKLYRFDNTDKAILVQIVYDFFRANNIIPAPTKEEISKAIDRQTSIKTSDKVTFSQAVSGAKALIKSTIGGEDSTEIQRRSEICKDCPLRDGISVCGSCGTAGKIARFVNTFKAKLGIRTTIDKKISLSYCGFCKCSLALIVVTKLKDFHEETPARNSSRPDVCWLKKTSHNYLP